MAEIWTVNLMPADKELAIELARRRAALGLTTSYAETIRAAMRLAMSATDEVLIRGTSDDEEGA